MSDTPTHSKTITISNKLGLHARAAAKFVKTVMKHDAELTVQRGSLTANGRSILGLMMLAATKGSQITLNAKGEDALKVIEALTELIQQKFGEEA
ncbi:MAG: HPr family phosphocarrier protein [Alphaproteobacteria bacterium GM202ARS2]|nr:HPr family phosphocarrier protein [Alphaproteobacteria bacterium GM202ARS2]